MSTPLTGQQIINSFHLYCGDQSDLSTTDELNLLNNVYQNVMQSRAWSFLKKTATGSILTDSSGNAYIPFPSDYRFIIENNQKTDNADTTYNNASQKVIFTGANYTPNQVVNWSDRRQFRNSAGFVYPDVANSRFVFTVRPADTTYEFDYIANWPDLTLTTSPLFPADFHNMLFNLMAVDSTIINLFDRSHSYAAENQASADRLYKALCYWDSMQTYN